MLVDSHCHLNFDVFQDDLDEVVARATAAGVGRMVTICTRMDQFHEVRAIAEKYDSIYCSVGVHPHEASYETNPTAEDLIEAAMHPKVVAIGETGLDFYYDNAPRDAQEANFRAHIEAARVTGLPLVVHTRDADDDTIRIMQEEAQLRGPYPGVIHCFTAGQAVADMALKLGFVISLSGILTFKKAEDLRTVVKGLPLESVLVETDSPYLAPIPNRGQRNEPSYVVHTAEKLAEVLSVDGATLAQASTDNFFRVFNKVSRPDDVA